MCGSTKTTWGRSDFKYEENLAQLSPDYIDGDAEGSDFAATLTRLAPALITTDFRSITKLDCPTFIFAGRYDYETPSAVAAEWIRKLAAPKKGIFWFEHSAHMTTPDPVGAELQEALGSAYELQRELTGGGMIFPAPPMKVKSRTED